MASRRTSQRWLSLALLLLACGLFCGANWAAADLRYPLAVFVLALSVICLGVALCLLSSRLGEWFGRTASAVLEIFLG